MATTWPYHYLYKNLMLAALYQVHDLGAGRIDFDQLAILHLQHAVNILAHAQVMRHHDPGPILLVDQPGEGFHHLVSPFGIQAGSWLVGQHQAGVVD